MGKYTRMTFFWGKNSEILFTMWPGTSAGYYALAIIFCFFLSFIIEWLSSCRLTRPEWSPNAVGATRTILYVIRWGLSDLVMLALMSFNGGVFLAVVAGNVAGFALFGCDKECESCEVQAADGCWGGKDLPPNKCCGV